MAASSSNMPTERADRPTATPLFPDAPRLVYKRNPLAEVICQVRFPSVLRIETDLPAAFQDEVRKIFPIYNEESASGGGIPQEVLQVFGGNLPAGLIVERARKFLSEDESWSITLTKDFLALSAKSYHRWEEFRRHLELALDALRKNYEPAFYTRIGLRYRNVVRRSTLALDAVKWPDLLRHELVGELAAEGVSQYVEQTTRRTLVALPAANAKVNIRHGLAVDGSESCYVIDNDFFIENKTELSNAFNILQYFSGEAHRLFRWCILDKLHEAMGPQPLE